MGSIQVTIRFPREVVERADEVVVERGYAVDRASVIREWTIKGMGK